jgi:hypothetical protein
MTYMPPLPPGAKALDKTISQEVAELLGMVQKVDCRQCVHSRPYSVGYTGYPGEMAEKPTRFDCLKALNAISAAPMQQQMTFRGGPRERWPVYYRYTEVVGCPHFKPKRKWPKP